jgi:hypothetical protein
MQPLSRVLLNTQPWDSSRVVDNVTLTGKPAAARAAHRSSCASLDGNQWARGKNIRGWTEQSVVVHTSAALSVPYRWWPRIMLLELVVYAVGTSTDYEAIAQTYTELVFQCPQAITANESAAAGYPTWRYLFNATFANTQDGSFKVYLLDLILDFLIVPAYILHHGEKPVRAEGEPNTGRRQTAKELKQEEKDEEAKGSEELDQTAENREHY